MHIDACGFFPSVTRRYGNAPKCQHVDDRIFEHRRPRTSLIAARIGLQFEEPFLFEGTCETERFNPWLNARRCPRLARQHLVIMDTAQPVTNHPKRCT